MAPQRAGKLWTKTHLVLLLLLLEVLLKTENVTYGNVVRPISIQQVYFGRLTAHGYSQIWKHYGEN